MEAKLHTLQITPEGEARFMHTASASKKEMLHFYLIMNRFVNLIAYFMQGTDLEHLEDLHRILGQHGACLRPLENHSSHRINQLTHVFSLL